MGIGTESGGELDKIKPPVTRKKEAKYELAGTNPEGKRIWKKRVVTIPEKPDTPLNFEGGITEELSVSATGLPTPKEPTDEEIMKYVREKGNYTADRDAPED